MIRAQQEGGTMRGHVIAIGIVHIIFAALSTCVSLVAFVGGTFLMSWLGVEGDAAKRQVAAEAVKHGSSAAEAEAAAGAVGFLASFGTAIFAACGALLLIGALLHLFAGIGCLKTKGYGRVLAIILGILGCIGLLLSLATINILGILVGGFAVYEVVIMFNGETARLFREAAQQA
jgi:hypothetical protein